MAFFRFFKAKDSEPTQAGGRTGGPEARVQDMRMRARHRLIGAVALVVLAVIVFPLLFDTEQRPAVIDAPVVIADAGSREAQEAPPAPVVPDAGVQPAGDVAGTAVAEVQDDVLAAEGAKAGMASDAEGAENREDWALGPEVEPLPEPDAPDPDQEPSATRSKIRVVSAPAERESARADAERAAEASQAAAAGRAHTEPQPQRPNRTGDEAEARRALAALQGRVEPQQVAPRPQTQTGRFVVQVGAFAQEDQVRSVQQRIAQAGLKSYTQVVQTGAGPRTRVRVGPYDSRDAAERARAALEKGGLPGQVLAP